MKTIDNLDKLNSYPDYLREYFYTMIRPVLTVLLLIFSKFLNDKSFQRSFLRDAQQWLDNIGLNKRDKISGIHKCFSYPRFRK